MKLSLLFQLVTALVCLPAGAATLPAPAKAFLQKHCFECHDADTQKGKLRLDNLAADFTSPVNADIWGRVFAQLEKREMPPKKKAQPSDAERQAVLDWLGPQLRAALAARQQAQGRVELRRLNRAHVAGQNHVGGERGA
jgi:mono/diheme cytochrome c family protein